MSEFKRPGGSLVITAVKSCWLFNYFVFTSSQDKPIKLTCLSLKPVYATLWSKNKHLFWNLHTNTTC